MRLANFKISKIKLETFYRKKGKTDFAVDPRIPINFRPLKWIITPQQINRNQIMQK
jgi:hypothetical protein